MRVSKPKISVVMAAYNAEKYIALAIESILEQTFNDFELLVINDASTDDTLEIIKGCVKADKRVALLNNTTNLGQTASRNKALKMAKGKYIAIMDADDIALPSRFELQHEYLENNKRVFLLGGNIDVINENGEIRKTPKLLTNSTKIRETLIKSRNCICHPTVMFRNEEYFYRSKFRYGEDYDFYLLLLSDNKILSALEDKLLKYRVSSTGIGRSRKGQELLFADKAREFYHERIDKGSDSYEDFTPEEILDIDVETSSNKKILEFEIIAKFEQNDFLEVRRFYKKYFKNYGFLNKFLIYYLSSFLGLRIINILRKIIF